MTWPAWGKRWVTRCGWVAGFVTLLVLLPATAAVADPEDDILDLGQTPASLSWIQLQDSQGISVWNHELSLDRGGMTAVDKQLWSSIVDVTWGIYRSGCVLAIWFLDWVMSMTWLGPISAPVLAVGDALQAVIDGLGLVPALLTITAIVCVVWMARGKWATGVWELAMALVIASLATGVFAQPVRMVIGPEGYIEQTALAGQEIAAAIATGDSQGKTPEQLRAAQTGQLIDIFVRYPTQLINYGTVLDNGPCEGAYNDVVEQGPYGYESDIRDAVGDCEKTYGEYAENPSGSMTVGSVVFVPASVIILLLAIVFSGSVIAAGVTVLYQSVKAIVTLVAGLLPGGGRGSLLITVAEVLTSLLILLLTSVFLAVFLQVIGYMFTAGENLAQTFLIIDILMLLGIVIYWRQRKRIKKSAEQLAQWMGQRPGGPATKMPQRERGGGMGTAMGAVRTVTSMSQARHARAAANRAPSTTSTTYVDNRQQAMMFGGPAGSNPRPGPVQGPDQDLRPRQTALNPGRPGPPAALGPARSGPDPTAPSQTGSSGPPGPDSQASSEYRGGGSGSGLRRVTARSGKVATGVLVRAGTNAALGAATGGGSLAVTGALSAARTAKTLETTRRAAVGARLATATAAQTMSASRATPAAHPSSPQRSAASQQVITGEVVPARPATPSPARNNVHPAAATAVGKADPRPAPASRPEQAPGPASPGPASRAKATAPTAARATAPAVPRSAAPQASRAATTAASQTAAAAGGPRSGRAAAEAAQLERLQARMKQRQNRPGSR